MDSRVSLGNAGSPASVFQPLLEGRLPYSRLQHTTILPMDQMKPNHLENDYVENPIIAQPSSKTPSGHNRLPHQDSAGSSHRDLGCDHHQLSGHSSVSWDSQGDRPGSISSSSSTSSDQRLLDHAAPPSVADQRAAVQSQPMSSCPQVGRSERQLAAPGGWQTHVAVRGLWEVQVYPLHLAQNPSLLVGLQPEMSVQPAGHGELRHLHVSSQRDFLPLYQRGRGWI